MGLFVGIDIGSSSVKACLFNGTEFTVVRASYRDMGDGKEQNPMGIAHTVADVCQRIFSTTGYNPRDIEGIGLSGHGPSIVFIDAHGKPCSPLVSWQDNRAMAEAKALRSIIPGFQKDGTSYEAKLSWFNHHQSACFSLGCTALYPKDFLVYLLTGERVVDISTASTFAFFNRSSKSWCDEFMDFPSHVLPRVVNSWDSVGKTGTAFSRDCGLPNGINVYPGGIDAYCGAIGAGAVVPDVVVEETGTSTCISRCYPGGLGADLHVLPDLSLSMKVLSYTGGSFSWFLDIMENSDLKKLSDGMHIERPKNILFLPYLIGERSPIWDEKAMGAFIGLRHDTNRQDILQAIMQGTSFAIHQNIQLLEQSGSTICDVHAVGGSARDSVWLQMKANITGKRYKRMKQIDASSIGAALIAAIGSNTIGVSDIPGIVAWEAVFEPDYTIHEAYGLLYQTYTQLYERLKPVFHTLHDA